jgi:rhomboid domain-containing protein 1
MNYRRNNNRNNASPLIMSLLFQIWQALSQLPVKPPLTMALLAINITIHINPPQLYLLGYNVASIGKNCLNPKLIIVEFQNKGNILFNRLFLSSVIHADDSHLYYNMISLLWKGINIEHNIGTEAFTILFIFSLIVSHLLIVIIAILLESFGISHYSGYNTCSIGFSAVLFSFKYVLNHSDKEMNNIMGIKIQSKYAAWLELILISLMNPSASFIGHLSGIFAGILYCHSLPLIRKLSSNTRYVNSNGNIYNRRNR